MHLQPTRPGFKFEEASAGSCRVFDTCGFSVPHNDRELFATFSAPHSLTLRPFSVIFALRPFSVLFYDVFCRMVVLELFSFMWRCLRHGFCPQWFRIICCERCGEPLICIP